MNVLKITVKKYVRLLFGFVGLWGSTNFFLQGANPNYQVVVYPHQITYAQPGMFDVATTSQPYMFDTSYPHVQKENTTTSVLNVPMSSIVEPSKPVILDNPVVSSEPVKPVEKTFIGTQVDNLTTWAKNHPLEAIATAVLLAKTAHGVKQFSDEVGIKNTLETAAATAQHKIKRRIDRVINDADRAAHARFE